MPLKNCIFICLFTVSVSTANGAPPLPGGLVPSKPSIPDKLVAPSLPNGIAAPGKTAPNKGGKTEELISITGFWELRAGIRTQTDRNQHQPSIAESRLQLELQKEFDWFTATVVNDFLFDAEAQSRRINLHKGQGWIDLREAHIAFSPLDLIDVKTGRQILTWGTGDLIFINDLFPKDWQAFFIGRDVEYLKAPSDAVKVSLFSDLANLDVVYTPNFNADRSISGKKISYYNTNTGQIVGRNAIVNADRPNQDEWALRLYKNIGANELAIYAYDGFWKSPAGVNAITGKAVYPRMRSIGSSLRRPFFSGIANIEMGYYHSRDAQNGKNPLIKNSEFRLLAGYEQELIRNLTVGLQYYVELMQDYHNYQKTLPAGLPVRDESRHVLTTRLTWQTMNQNLIWSLFSYYSPSDQDAYLRPNVHYKISDHWSAEIGGNFFIGEKQHSFFSQFQKNNNVYASFRFGF